MRTKIPREPHSMQLARGAARRLYGTYKSQEKRGRDCGPLFWDWVHDCFWGLIVKDHLPIFDAVWQMLKERGHRRRNPYTYGDIDESVWIEATKDEHMRVVVSIRHCAMADDNTHIFIRTFHEDCLFLNTFRVVRTWPRERKGHYGIEQPSVWTYRKAEFHFGYRDCRDPGHVLVYQDFDKRVEHSEATEPRIAHALWTLRGHHQALQEQG